MLPKPVQSLREKYEERFQAALRIEEEAVQAAIPYYTDLRTNKYAVLENKDHQIEDEDPYNIALSSFLERNATGSVFMFQDNDVKIESRALLEDVATYIHKINKDVADYRVELGNSTRSDLFKKINSYIADLYWENQTGLTDPLIPKEVLSKFLNKKVELKAADVLTHRKILVGTLKSFNKGPNADRMANAYCHLLRHSIGNMNPHRKKLFAASFISQHRRFTPTLQMLVMKGYVPDVKVKKYKSLFLLSEWNEISESAIYKAETEINEMLRKQLSHSTFLDTIKRIQEIQSDLELDRLSSEIKKVRKERLFVASSIKAKRGKRTSTKTLGECVADALEEKKVREAFNPFRIHFARGRLTTTPGEAINVIVSSDDSMIYRYDRNSHNDAKDEGRVASIALEFLAFLHT
jgi:hypothetical protein